MMPTVKTVNIGHIQIAPPDFEKESLNWNTDKVRTQILTTGLYASLKRITATQCSHAQTHK